MGCDDSTIFSSLAAETQGHIVGVQWKFDLKRCQRRPDGCWVSGKIFGEVKSSPQKIPEVPWFFFVLKMHFFHEKQWCFPCCFPLGLICIPTKDADSRVSEWCFAPWISMNNLSSPYVLLIHTPWKIDMEPTNHPFRKENYLNQTSMIMCKLLIFRGVDSHKSSLQLKPLANRIG